MVDRKAVEKVFERVRPLFVEHQGNFDLVDITKEGVVKVRLVGTCEMCIYKEKTARAIETMLKKEVPGVTRVQPVP